MDLPHWWGPGPKTSYLAPWGYSNPHFKEGKPGEHIEDRMAFEAVTWLQQRDHTKPFFLELLAVFSPCSFRGEARTH